MIEGWRIQIIIISRAGGERRLINHQVVRDDRRCRLSSAIPLLPFFVYCLGGGVGNNNR